MKESDKSCKINKYTIDYYSNKWENFDIDKLKKRIQNFEPIIDCMLKDTMIEKPMNILDIGTGPGTLPIAIINKYNKKSNLKIYAIDPSSVSISIAIKLAKKFGYEDLVFFKKGKFEEIPFPNNFFDLIISNASFNLCVDKKKAIDEIKRVIKKQGMIIIADCFREKNECQAINNNEELWAHCISGAISTEWLI